MSYFILIFIICLKSSFCQSTKHCMYAESFECWSKTSSQMVSQDYYFTFIWNSAQSSITSSTFSLIGYQMATINKYMSFSAYFYAVTSTYGQFQFIPLQTSFFKARFYLMLFSPCIDQIVVTTICNNRGILVFSGQTDTIMQSGVGLTFGNNMTRYTRAVFIRYILQQATPVALGNTEIYLLPIQPGVNYDQIQVKTTVAVTIEIGYLLFVKRSNQAILQMYQSYSVTGYQQLKATAIYAPNGKYKCFIGLSILNELSNKTSPYFLKSLDFTSNPSYEVIFDYTRSSFNHGKFILFCLAKCSGNMVPDYSTSPLSCTMPVLPRCIQAINSTHCRFCQPRYYNNVNSTCELCSDTFSNCDQCSNSSCSKCLDNFMLYIQPTNISCVVCNIVIEHCLTCDSYSCFSCQNGFYIVSSCPYPNNCTYICMPCLQQCFSCIDTSACIECQIGSPVQGGCTDIPSCVRVNSNASYKSSRCTECSFPALLSSNHRCQRCQKDYIYANPYCVKTIGCTGSVKINQTIICIMCDIKHHFQSKPINSSCYCMRGFSIVNNTCLEICGDGQTHTLECDDSNLFDRDGCSSKCTIENGFSCINSQNQTSQCRYYRKDIIVKLQNIEKVQLQNKVIMTFAIIPQISLDKIMKEFTFTTNRSIVLQNKQIKRNKLTLWILFNEDLEDYDAKLSIFFENITLYQFKAEVQFKMLKNGLLVILQNLTLLRLGMKFSYYFAIVISIINFLSLFFHKIIGLQFLFPFQIIYMLYISNTHPTTALNILNSFGLSCFNFLVFSNGYSNVLTNGSTRQFSDQNMEFTIKVVFIGIVSLSILKITKLIVKRKCVNLLQKSYKLKYLFFVIDNFLFSMSIRFMMILFILLMGDSMTSKQTLKQLLMFPMQIIISLLYFNQWRRNILYQTIAIHLPKPAYIPIFLIFYISACLVFPMASLKFIYDIQIVCTVILFKLLIIILFYRPYKTILHNFGIILSILITIFFCIWLKMRNQSSNYRSQQNQILILAVLIVLMLASATLTIARIIKVIQKMCSRYSITQKLPLPINSSQNRNSLRQQNKKLKNKYLLKENIDLREFKQILWQRDQSQSPYLKLVRQKKRWIAQKRSG